MCLLAESTSALLYEWPGFEPLTMFDSDDLFADKCYVLCDRAARCTTVCSKLRLTPCLFSRFRCSLDPNLLGCICDYRSVRFLLPPHRIQLESHRDFLQLFRGASIMCCLFVCCCPVALQHAGGTPEAHIHVWLGNDVKLPPPTTGHTPDSASSGSEVYSRMFSMILRTE